MATQRSRLAVGFQTSIGRGLRPVISARFQERRPGWSVDFKQVSWSDASAGLLDGSSHVAILWLPVPDSAALSWRVLASEPRWVALSQGTGSPVAGPFPFAELLEEPFLAPPASAGPLRDYSLATEERGERPIRIAAEASTHRMRPSRLSRAASASSCSPEATRPSTSRRASSANRSGA